NAQAIFATRAVVDDNLTADLLHRNALTPVPHEVSLRGIEREIAVYTIP
ncbi:MAG: adenylate/guanylate cyclase domain-containing protein, partial [Mesorhizobium sp.]